MSGLRLLDQSVRARWGVKGRGALDWLAAHGAPVPGTNNAASRLADGTLLVRLAPSEVLVLATSPQGVSAIGRAIETLPAEGEAFCYPVPRRDSHAWFVVAGASGAALFRKLCGVDLLPERFADGRVAQTSVARLAAIVVRDDVAGELRYHLLADSASAEYLWECLLDGTTEFHLHVD